MFLCLLAHIPLLDVDNSSSINAQEFRRLVRDLGYHLSPNECKLQIKLIVQREHRDEIEFGEFKNWWIRHADKLNAWDSKELERYQYFSNMFDRIGRDESGSIDASEFDPLYEEMINGGFTLPEKDILLKDMDTDGNGRISFNEFVEYLKTTDAFNDWKIE